MKIAVPTSQGFVEDHVTCCECYTIFTVDEQYNIIERESLLAGHGSCCIDSPAARLRRFGVSVLLAGNIESSLYSRMTGYGLEVHRNYHGEVDTVIKSYLDKLVAGSCSYCDSKTMNHHLNN